MQELDRLLQILGFLLVVASAVAWLRHRQGRAVARHANELTGSVPTLIAVVSAKCAVCPAQKRVLERLGVCYPASTLRIETIELEREPQRVRELRVMTVPATLLLAADGTLCQINHGLTSLEKLKSQIRESFSLCPRNDRDSRYGE